MTSITDLNVSEQESFDITNEIGNTDLDSFLRKNGAENYEILGTRAAGAHNGSTTAFKIWLTKIENVFFVSHKFKDKNKEDEIAELKAEITNCEASTKQSNEKIERLKSKIHDVDEKIGEVKLEKKEKISIYIGVFILVALTIYLFLFYSSAVYSAIFRVIEPGTAIFTTIFFPKALSVSFKEDIFEGLLVTFSPFIFIGLGFLIHKFSEKGKMSDYFKMTIILIVTFIFDGIIAYEITEKIYSANNIIKAVPGPDYNIALAITEINFWLILFAGFVVYIVWGLIISFVLNELNPHREISNRIEKLRNQKMEYNDEILLLNNDITTNNSKIKKMKEEISNKGKTISFNVHDLKSILSAFTTGYIKFLKSANHLNVKECNDIYINKLNSIKSTN